MASWSSLGWRGHLVKREIRYLPEHAWQAYRTAEGLITDREIA
jgi:hypothetical protein